MRRIGLIFGLLTTASMAVAEPVIIRDLTETAAPFEWLPGNSGVGGEGVRIRRGLIPEPPPVEVTSSQPNFAERALARIERDRALRLLRDINRDRRDVIVFVTDRRGHLTKPTDAPVSEPMPGLNGSYGFQIINN